MPPLVSLTVPPRARRTFVRSLVLPLALLGGAARAAESQVYLTHMEDASPVPTGMLRVRVTTGWTRFDERFATSGRTPLGDDISTTAFGAAQLPRLAPVETGLQTLAGDPAIKLSFGRIDAVGDARIVSTPIALEYGLTRRLSVGMMIPLIQTRRSFSLRVNPDSTNRGNVGYVPPRLRQDAAQANTLVYDAFKRAADSLATLIARCPANPNATGCAAVNANAADAAATRLQAQQFADAVRIALGTDTASTIVAPRTDLAARIDDQRSRINAKVQKYLGASAGASTSVFSTSTSLTYVDLQGRNETTGLLRSTVGGIDSIRTTNKLVLGGITVAAQYLLFDHFQADTSPAHGIQSRLSIGGALRFEPNFADSAITRGVIGVGDGPGAEVRSAMDIIAGNVGGTVAARFVKSFARPIEIPLGGDPDAYFAVPAFGAANVTAGTVIGVDVTPRLLLGEWLALDAHYGFERTGAATYELTTAPPATLCPNCGPTPAFAPNLNARTAQRVGFGVRYSSVDAYLRGRVRTPIEVSFTHLETITGDAGVPKLQRDQVQVRLFLRIRKRS
jgi:hypothetical protein